MDPGMKKTYLGQMERSVNYPMNLMMLFMHFEKMIGDDLVTGLSNLKTELEN